jgi:hypothetical protein
VIAVVKLWNWLKPPSRGLRFTLAGGATWEEKSTPHQFITGNLPAGLVAYSKESGKTAGLLFQEWGTIVLDVVKI